LIGACEQLHRDPRIDLGTINLLLHSEHCKQLYISTEHCKQLYIW